MTFWVEEILIFHFFVSFSSRWVPELLERFEPDTINFFVVGAKVDLRQSRQGCVTTAEGEALAKKIGALGYAEVGKNDSAATNTNTIRMFANRFNLLKQGIHAVRGTQTNKNASKLSVFF